MWLLCSTPPSPCSLPFMWLLLLSSQLSSPESPSGDTGTQAKAGTGPHLRTMVTMCNYAAICLLVYGCLLSSVHASVRAETASTLRATLRSLAPGQNLCAVFFPGQTMGTYKARPGRPDRGKLPSPHQTWCTALHCSGEGCCSKGLGLPGWSRCYSHPYS